MIQSLSVVIPAFNEGPRIGPALETMADYLSRQPYRFEIIVVDDGSRDDTQAQVTSRMKWIPSLRLMKHSRNEGKGAAVRTGLKAAQGEAALFCDADGSIPIEEIERFLPLLESPADLVVGSRRLNESRVLVKQPWIRRFMSDVYHLLCKGLIRARFSDATCGFKLLNRKALTLIPPRMRIPRWSFDVEIFTIARIHHLKTVEVPVSWADQKGTKVRLFKDAVGSFWELIQIWARSFTCGYQRP